MNTTYRHLHLFLLEKSMSSPKQKIYIHLHLTVTFDCYRFCSIALKILKYLLFPQNSVLKTNFPHSFAITKY